MAVGLHVGVPIYRQQGAIREIERLGGSVERLSRGPDWFRRWMGNRCLKEHLGHEWPQLFDAVKYVRLPPDELTFRHRFSGLLSGPSPFVRGPSVSDECPTLFRQSLMSQEQFIATGISNKGKLPCGPRFAGLDRLHKELPGLDGLCELRVQGGPALEAGLESI